jgi:flagellin-like protein
LKDCENCALIRSNNKALSPVIASIILIAVTVTVAVVVASWMGGLSIGLMGNAEQATITNVAFLTSPADSVNVTVLNSGTSSLTLQSALIDENTVSITVTGPTNSLTVPKGTPANILLTNSGSFVSGVQYTIKITTAKGNTLLYTAKAQEVIDCLLEREHGIGKLLRLRAEAE